MNALGKRVSGLIRLGYAIILIGVIVLIGWQFDITVLKALIPGITPMNPVTAISFICCGAWLILYHLKKRKPKILFPFLELFIFYVGLLHVVTYIYPIENIRLDYLFFRDKILAENFPNRIAPNTALVFFLCSLSMMIMRSANRAICIVKDAILLFAFLFPYLSVIGYIYNIQPAYRFGGFTPMALVTAFTFLVLVVGLFLSEVRHGLPHLFISDLSGGRLARFIIPFILIFPPVTGYFRLLGEKKGLYPPEFGTELHTFVFVSALFIFISMYTYIMNRKETMRLRSQAELAESEKRFRTLMNSLKEGVARLDMKGNIIFCNPAFSAITGFSEEELRGNNAIKILIPVTNKISFIRRLVGPTEGNKEYYQAEIIKKTGERIWVSIRSGRVSDVTDSEPGVLVTINDITEEVSNIQDLSAFTASAAHDLNAPLSRIISMSDVLHDESLETEERKVFLDGINDTATAMRKLLKDLLQFSKLGSTQLEKAEIDLNPIVKEVCTFYTNEAYKGELAIKPLPRVSANESAVRQLYTNLISNAIKYSSKKVNPKVEIGCDQKNGVPVYYVKDNGIGLDMEKAKNLFQPFKRFHSQFEGNGMGLAIVKRIIEKHGGMIWAESNPNEGLCFNFTFSHTTMNK